MLSKTRYTVTSAAPSLHCLSKGQVFQSSSSTPSLKRWLTKQACLSLLQNCKSMAQLKQIHCQILVSSLRRSQDIADHLLVFCTNPDSGDLSHAAKVFESLDSPSVFHYNLIIKAFAKKGRFANTLSLFCRMRSVGVSPDNFTYPFVLKSMGSLKLVSDGRKAHALIVKSGFEFDSFTRVSLMDMYAGMGNVETSRILFDEMPKRGVIYWNVLITGYVKCQKFEDAVAAYGKMEEEGIKADESTLVSTLTACIPLNNMELGKKIHFYMDEKLRFSINLGNALLDMYTKCSSVDKARRFFDSMPSKNVISWTSMVSGYVNCGELDEARKLFEKSPAKDVVLWTAMINGYVQHNRFDGALDLFKEMQLKGVKPDKFTVVALLMACSSLGALKQGRWIHGYIEDSGIQLDTVVRTALIDMYAKCGCMEVSLKIFTSAKRRDTAMWTVVIYGLAMNGETRKALEFFSEMTRVGPKPDDITFIGVLSACSHGGLVTEGRQYFHDMQDIYQIKPKLEHYGCLVDLLGRAGLLDEAEGLIKDIPKGNVVDELPLWGSLLGACSIYGNVDMGERLAKMVLELEFGNSGVHTLIANMYATADKWEDVSRVRRKMNDRGIKKAPGCSLIEVDGVIREFHAGYSLYPESREIYSVLHTINTLMNLGQGVQIDSLTCHGDCSL